MDSRAKNNFFDAILFGDVELVRSMLNSHDGILKERLYGQTSLMIAIIGNKLNVASILLLKSDEGAQNKGVETTLARLAKDYLDIVKILLPKSDVNAQDSNKKTTIMYAIENDSYEIVKMLLDSGADVKVCENGKTTLQYAFNRGNLEMVKLLLDSSVDPNTSSVLATICAFDYLEIVRLLLKYGADPNKQCSEGKSPLSVACSAGKIGTVRLLLEQKSIDVNIVDQRRMTPLMDACRRGRLQVAEHLVSLPHVNVGLRNCNNETAIFYAIRTKNLDLVKAVLGRVKPTESDRQTACEYGTAVICREITLLLRA
ncbi:MAG: hypothetical protein A6F71_10325 [Cycloclasticus sp. symbiont of Poecilosclerida sp. M]|nr:MAG: hypothetical protein A6F71_10325 [Cycloclasticus sp. symbiont of Poecilosclerida sp. M]